TGALPLPNGTNPSAPDRDGVTVTPGEAITVAYNVISGNAGTGVVLHGNPVPAYAQVHDNLIGTDATGRLAVGNGGDGVASTALGRIELVSNTVAANGGNGVIVSDSSPDTTSTIIVSGNY